MPPRPQRDDKSRIAILEAYERAKAKNPRMTQAQFMMQGAPGASIKNAPGQFKSEEAASRYFRKIRSGERTGGAMYRAGRETGTIGLYQIRARLEGGKFISQNISVESAYSTFDIPAIEHDIKTNRRERVEAMIAHYRERYGQEEAEIDMDDVEVRTIRHQRKPIRMRLSLD